MTLSDYIAQVHEHRVAGGRKTHYLFRGHPIPFMSEANDSFVPYALCPTPDVIYKAATKIPSGPMGPRAGPRGNRAQGHKHRENFVNAQWALGAEGSGAPMHFHNAAW
jgi:hypothetical protein